MTQFLVNLWISVINELNFGKVYCDSHNMQSFQNFVWCLEIEDILCFFISAVSYLANHIWMLYCQLYFTQPKTDFLPQTKLYVSRRGRQNRKVGQRNFPYLKIFSKLEAHKGVVVLFEILSVEALGLICSYNHKKLTTTKCNHFLK